MIGEKLSPVLNEIEQALWEFEFNFPGTQPDYSEDGFRSALKIVMSAMMDKMWDLQQKEGIDMKIREAMAIKCGEDFRNLVRKYTNIDPHDLYKINQ
jgi:uncharacterized protein YutE (UPF0331/DUF86 family)